jgi:hypothetical protein
MATLLMGRCNPYGAETGGPAGVLGKLHGPNSAKTPGMGLPANVEQGEWRCPQPAQVRCRMVCRCGHTGQVMALCSWHDETAYNGEYVAGTFRRVSKQVRTRGHYEEIGRRQAGSCPRCLFPGDFAALYHEMNRYQAELQFLWTVGEWNGARATMLRQAVEDARARFDEGNALGIIHNCALELVAVS